MAFMQDQDGRWHMPCHFFGDTAQRPAQGIRVAMTAQHDEIDLTFPRRCDDGLGRMPATRVTVGIPPRLLV
jgi:hypothetical protein